MRITQAGKETYIKINEHVKVKIVVLIENVGGQTKMLGCSDFN